MRTSDQDRHYIETEADAFFDRNHGEADPQTLRPGKRRIAEAIEACGVKPQRVLEFGCNYGDLVHHYAQNGAESHGVEPSARAVEFGRQAYGDTVGLHQGTIAENPLGQDARYQGAFDLVIVEDVFCWVSRETLFQSIARIDDLLAEGGFLFIREFYPRFDRKNRNHHVDGVDVFCFKPAATHARIFTASGIYARVWQNVWMDHTDAWVNGEAGSGERDPFDSRWSDTILHKSYSDYYRE